MPPFITWLLCRVAACLVLACSVAGAQPTVFRNGNVIDVLKGESRRADLVIEGGRIATITAANRAPVPAGARVVDATALWIIPGLWDMHTHIWDRRMLFPVYARYGITSVRDMGSVLERWHAWNDSVAAGHFAGPRGYPAGQIVDGFPAFSFFFSQVRTAEEGARIVEELRARGASFIKVYDRLSRDAYLAIALAARRAGIPIGGHVPPGVSIDEAVAAGHRSVEHLTGIIAACSAHGDSLRLAAAAALDSARSLDFRADTSLRPRVVDAIRRAMYMSREEPLASCETSRLERVARLLREHRVAVVPTLVVGAPRSFFADSAAEDSASRSLPEWVRGMSRLGPDSGQLRDVQYRREQDIVALLRRGGVTVLAGSDAPNPGSTPGIGLHRELELMVAAGYPPAEALRMATSDAARFLEVGDSLGVIREGAVADLVLLTANPLHDIRNTRRIQSVMMRGRLAPTGSP